MVEGILIAIAVFFAVYGFVSAAEDLRLRFFKAEKGEAKPVIMCKADADTAEFVARRVRAISESAHLEGAIVVPSEREKQMTSEILNVKVLTSGELSSYLNEHLQ